MGESVRYDGSSKYSEVVCNGLRNRFQLIPICPEVEAGLSVPRPPVELVQIAKSIKVRGRDNPSIDVTQQLTSFCDAKVLTLNALSGFIHTPRSPSCGVQSVIIKSANGAIVNAHGTGVFTQSLIKASPQLPIIEEPDLLDKHQFSIFILRAIFYYGIQNEKLSRLSCGFIDEMAPVILNAKVNKTSQMNSVNIFLDSLNINEIEVLLVKMEQRVVDL